jgi:hypothetical protein
MIVLTRGWLAFIGCTVFLGPALAAAVLAVAVVSALYLSIYVMLVVPILCCFSSSRVKCFPEFFSIGEHGM